MGIKLLLWLAAFLFLRFSAEELGILNPEWPSYPLSFWIVTLLLLAGVNLSSLGILCHLFSRSTADMPQAGRFIYRPRDPVLEDRGTFFIALGLTMLYALVA